MTWRKILWKQSKCKSESIETR